MYRVPAHPLAAPVTPWGSSVATVTERRTQDVIPSWLPRAVLSVIGVILAVLAALWMAGQLRTLIFIVFIALFVAVALEPAVQFLVRHGWKRGIATTFVFASTVLLWVGFIAALVPVFVAQASSLARNLPGYIADVQRWLDSQDLFDLGSATGQLADQLRSAGSIITQYGTRVAGGVFAFGNTVLGAIFRTVTTLLFAYYMVSEGPKMRRTLLSFLPQERQREILRIWDIAVEKTGGYIYSRLILAVVAASFTTLVLVIVDVPYAAAMGLWVGVLSQFVPVIGTYIAAALPVLVAIVPREDGTWNPGKALWVIIALVAYQQIENYFVAPKITARAMAIHPAVSVGAVIAGASLIGAIGAVLALPVAATIQAVISTALHRHELIDADALREPERQEFGGWSRRRTNGQDDESEEPDG